jgi:hypothetical protein
MHATADSGSWPDFGEFGLKHLGDKMVGDSIKTVSELAGKDVGLIRLFVKTIECQIIADIGNKKDEKAETDTEPDDVYDCGQLLLLENPECHLEVVPYHVHAPNVSNIS